MSNDLIRRGEVEDILCNAYDGTIDEGALAYLISELKKIPAVPHEMTAKEFFEEFQRMCHTVDGCSDCPILRIDSCAGFPCRYRAYLNPDKAVAVVEQWAEEHPEERSEQ